MSNSTAAPGTTRSSREHAATSNTVRDIRNGSIGNAGGNAGGNIGGNIGGNARGAAAADIMRVSRGMRNAVTLLVLGLMLALSLTAATGAHASEPRSQRTAKLLTKTVARSVPGGGYVIMHVPVRQSVTRTPTVLPVIGTRQLGHVAWLHVLLNGHHVRDGWINGEATQRGRNTWHVNISLAHRQAVIYHSGKVARRISVVIGKPSTPTPTGHYYITKRVPQPRSSILGPWVLYTSAWGKIATGGVGLEVALHGRRGLMVDPLGSARSHGCVRMNDSQVAWLARRLAVGTRVTIE